jgi:hypothetical protein
VIQKLAPDAAGGEAQVGRFKTGEISGYPGGCE